MATMARAFAHLYSTAAAFDQHDIDFATLDTSFGANNALGQAGVLDLVAATATRTPIVMAMFCADDPEVISIVHRPRAFPVSITGVTPMDGRVHAIHGNHEGMLTPIHLPEAGLGRSTARVLDDHVALKAAVDASGGFAAHIADNTAPNTTAVRARRVCVLPIEWATRALEIGSFSPAGFYDEFLHPLIGTADEAPYQAIRDWWRVASTTTDVGGHSSLEVAGTVLTTTQRATVIHWLARTARADIDMAVPFGMDPLTNTTFNTAMTQLSTQMAAHDTAIVTREDARVAPQTFAARYSVFVHNEMINITGAADEDHLPALMRGLALHKKQAEDIPFLRAMVDAHANEANCLADECTKPMVTNGMISMLREWRLVNVGEELTCGLSPFAIVCQGHPEARSASDRVDTQLRLEQNANAISCADAQIFITRAAKLPVDEVQCSEKLAGFSLMVDLVFGSNHALANQFRNCLIQVRGFLQSGLRVHFPDSPGKRLHVGLRIMFWFTTELFFYIGERRAGNDPAMPPWSQLTKMCQTRNFESVLPLLPESWLERVDDRPAANVPAPSPASTDAAVGGGSPKTRVTNENPNKGLIKRFKDCPHSNITDMLNVAKSKGLNPKIPSVVDEPICLTWTLTGSCWENCRRKGMHKYCAPATVLKVHELMDTCDVPTLPGAGSA